ncbi:MAG: dihydropteroate synthase [Verrucomicrobia bacterium]|nr:dihydropteroate synthase [Verrucomicrobiota bacterium]
MPTRWLINDRAYDLAARGWIMGVLNVTPDSFSDGGQYLDAARAVAHGLQMIADGAEVLDVGGESTRPGAEPVALDEEVRRVVPVIVSLRQQTRALISVDTMKPEVARAAIDAGADIINDVGGMRDPGMIETAATSRAGVIVMHMQGTPHTMQSGPHYEDVKDEVRAFFENRLEQLKQAGIAPERVALDPGIGFGKTPAHNLQLLRGLPALRVASRPLVLGVSRKSLIAHLLDDAAMDKRRWPTVALTAWLRETGADVLRVHDVKENVEALRMIEAIMG